ncbi:MAG: fasciclin domain-containing protein [Balneolaceae bacterium]|nr:fasciclin domain-containing protein [Balneolaceae bacterium]
MNTIKTMLSITLVTLLSVVLVACQQKSDQSSEDLEKISESNRGQAYVVDEDSKPNILQIARASEAHSTLATAIEAAGVQNVLVNAGPLTVFAPNNKAFEKLPEGTVENLLKPENKSKLSKIITSHASPANLHYDQLKDGMQVYLATGQYVEVEVKDGEKYVHGAKILDSIDASNGVIHIVDQVFLFDESSN